MATFEKKAKLHISENESAVSEEVCNFIVSVAAQSVLDHGYFYVGLSGLCIKL